MKVNEYVENILQYVAADETIKSKLRYDLTEHIQSAGGEEAIKRMGSPKEMATELMDALYTDKTDVIRELIKAKAEAHHFYEYEYKSRLKLFGLPLLHIYFGRNRPIKAAKGIIAIGTVAIGVIAIGTISIGLFSLGALALGLLAIGGFAVGGWVWGGVALGIIAFGGFAIGMYTVGGVAIASHVAIGGIARGTVAIGDNAAGNYTIITTALEEVTKASVHELIEQALPNTPKWIMRIMTVFFR